MTSYDIYELSLIINEYPLYYLFKLYDVWINKAYYIYKLTFSWNTKQLNSAVACSAERSLKSPLNIISVRRSSSALKRE